MLLFLSIICYAAVLLKFTYYAHTQEQEFCQTIMLLCMEIHYNMLYHTMTVLLEYIDRSLLFSINAIILLKLLSHSFHYSYS